MPYLKYITKKLRNLNVGISYFPDPRRDKYHRITTLSLLCSEWEEVEHVATKHRHSNFATLEIAWHSAPLFLSELWRSIARLRS